MNPQTKQLLKLAKDISNVLFSLEMINQQAPVIVDFRKALTAFEQSTEQPEAIARHQENYKPTDVILFFAKYFNINPSDALDCHHMTLDCMSKFASQQTAFKDKKITELTNLLSDTNKRIQEIEDEEELKDKQLQVQQSHIDDQDQLIFEQDKEITELKEAISELIQVKDWKDKHGKDEHYLKAMPIAWENVRKLIQK